VLTTRTPHNPVEQEVGHAYMLRIVITYFYWEFHASLNSCEAKPANIGVRWGLVDHYIALCVNFVLSLERAPVRHMKKSFFTISTRNSGALTK